MMMRRLRSTLPSFVKKSDKLPPAIEEIVRIARADADGLIEALKKVGLWVEDLWDFSGKLAQIPSHYLQILAPFYTQNLTLPINNSPEIYQRLIKQNITHRFLQTRI